MIYWSEPIAIRGFARVWLMGANAHAVKVLPPWLPDSCGEEWGSQATVCAGTRKPSHSAKRMIYSTGLARRFVPESPAMGTDLRCQGVPAYEHKSLERRDALLAPAQEGFLPHSILRGIAWVPRHCFEPSTKEFPARRCRRMERRSKAWA